MNTAICTLFEGDYHYGLGALVNSLFAHSFRGVVWAGYRGKLPPWAQPITRAESYAEYFVAPGCSLRFVPVTTDRHLTNFKPSFMLKLWQDACPEAEALVYFDPDIVIKGPWEFFEEWVSYGVALCEDINSPFPSSHPIRGHWRRLAEQEGIQLTSVHSSYLNGGFVGVSKKQRGFLELWAKLLDILERHLGALSQIGISSRPNPFFNSDQDVLNMTAMVEHFPLSIMGREGMDFSSGGYTMSHAVGAMKPWRKQMLISALKGLGPTAADRGYWEHVQSPVRLYPPHLEKLHLLDLKAGAAVGRVIRRS